MRLGVVSDIHGNAVALDAVLADAEPLGIDSWWALGDLVLSGPRPVEVIETLLALPGVAFVRGNTDRYVISGELPPGDPAVDREVAMSIGWTRGALAHADLLDWLAQLPTRQRAQLPDGSRLLGIHASLDADEGPGINPEIAEDTLAPLLAGSDADVVVGGHTHWATDRVVGGVRALNPGSVGLPFEQRDAEWMVIDATDAGVAVEHRRVSFDAAEVVDDLRRGRHPGVEFIGSILAGTHPHCR